MHARSKGYGAHHMESSARALHIPILQALLAASGSNPQTIMNHFTSIRFLTEAGYKLSLSEETISTAAYYYHKFCAVMKVEDYDINLLLMASLNLASKVQELSTKLGDIVNVCHRCLHKTEPPLEISDLYWQLKESVARYELLLLRALKFDAQVQLPHSYLLHFLLALSRWVDEGVWSSSHVTRVAWALLQDIYYSDMCLRYPPSVLATGVMYLAVNCCKLNIPCGVRQWWCVFSPKTSELELQKLSAEIMDCTS